MANYSAEFGDREQNTWLMHKEFFEGKGKSSTLVTVEASDN